MTKKLLSWSEYSEKHFATTDLMKNSIAHYVTSDVVYCTIRSQISNQTFNKMRNIKYPLLSEIHKQKNRQERFSHGIY